MAEQSLDAREYLVVCGYYSTDVVHRAAASWRESSRQKAGTIIMGNSMSSLTGWLILC